MDWLIGHANGVLGMLFLLAGYLAFVTIGKKVGQEALARQKNAALLSCVKTDPAFWKAHFFSPALVGVAVLFFVVMLVGQLLVFTEIEIWTFVATSAVGTLVVWAHSYCIACEICEPTTDSPLEDPSMV